MTRLAAILLTLLAFAAASCNGDDPPSQDEFAGQANGICRQAEQSLENLAEEVESREEIPEAIDRVIKEARQTVDELDDLERPEGEAGETAEQFVNATRTEIQDVGIPALEELRGAVESDDRGAIREAALRLRGIDTSASNRAARELGATDCAKGR